MQLIALGPREFAAKEISTFQLSPNLTYGAGRPHIGLCPIFLVFFKKRLSKFENSTENVKKGF